MINSINDIWLEVMNNLSSQLTPTAIKTWFSDCVPVEITPDCRLILKTTNEFKKKIITERFGETIKTVLSDIFSCEFEFYVLADDDELAAYMEEKPDDNPLPEALGYTFDRFIVGKSNEFAHASAVAVAKNPGHIYNPLLIYGNSGLGKTHLMLAIGQYNHENNPDKKIMYVKGADFTNEVVNAIREGKGEEFRHKYRNIDLFLVDDIQFIAGKIQTQNEFFHIFNNIYESGHQIVITSDRPPREMTLLDDRLLTRFEGGLMADIQPPDLETRMAITRNKATQLGLILSDDAISFIAENITANIRQIEGVIKRLTAYKEILGDVITIESVKRAIDDVSHNGTYIPTPEVIIRETARYYSISEEDIRGQNRSKNTAMARHVSMYLMRSLTNLPLAEIGNEYGSRNHTTVLASIKKIEDMLKTNSEMAGTIRDITSNINSI